MEDNNELAFNQSNDGQIAIEEEFEGIDLQGVLVMNDGKEKMNEKKDGETVVDEEVADTCPTEGSSFAKQINNRYVNLGSLGGKPLDPLKHSESLEKAAPVCSVIAQPNPSRVLPIERRGRVLDFSQNGRGSRCNLLEGAQIVRYAGVRRQVNGLEGSHHFWRYEWVRREVSGIFRQEGAKSADEKDPSEQGRDQRDVEH